MVSLGFQVKTLTIFIYTVFISSDKSKLDDNIDSECLFCFFAKLYFPAALSLRKRLFGKDSTQADYSLCLYTSQVVVSKGFCFCQMCLSYSDSDKMCAFSPQ